MSNKYYLLTYLVTYLASRFMNGAAGRKMDESFDPTIMKQLRIFTVKF